VLDSALAFSRGSLHKVSLRACPERSRRAASSYRPVAFDPEGSSLDRCRHGNAYSRWRRNGRTGERSNGEFFSANALDGKQLSEFPGIIEFFEVKKRIF
jgi:hypothetical protein